MPFNLKHIGLLMRKYISTEGKILFYQTRKKMLNAEIITGLKQLGQEGPVVSVPKRKYIKLSIDQYDGFVLKQDAAEILKELVAPDIYTQGITILVDVNKLKHLGVADDIIDQLYTKIEYENLRYEVVDKPK